MIVGVVFVWEEDYIHLQVNQPEGVGKTFL